MSLLDNKSVLLNNEVDTRNKALNLITNYCNQIGVVTNVEKVIEKFIERETLGSTGMIDGFAIPHAQSVYITTPKVIVFKNNSEINDWETMDQSKVKIVFAILVPETSENNEHLRILSLLSQKLMNKELREQIIETNSVDKILELINL